MVYSTMFQDAWTIRKQAVITASRYPQDIAMGYNGYSTFEVVSTALLWVVFVAIVGKQVFASKYTRIAKFLV